MLAALLAVTFWRVLFSGEAFFYRDYGFLGYPFVHFHRECFWSGDFFPLWNPYVNCGAPFLAQWNTQTLYPGSLIYLLLPLPWSLGFFCIAHLFLGGMGMRALAERWTGSRFGAAVAGVAFVFSGLVLGCIIYPNYLVALGWMPWVALATRRAWREGGRSIVLAALAGAMQMLTGAPEIILLTWGFLAALLVLDWVQGLPAQGSGGEKNASSLTPALSRWEREGASAVGGAAKASLASPAVEDPAPKSERASLNPSQPTSPPLPAGEGRGEGERVPTPAQSATAHEPPTPLITNHFSLLTRFAAVIFLITGLCAAQLLPFFQLLSLSQRSGDAVNTFWSLPGWGWVNLFFPLFMNFQTEQGVFVMIGQSFFPSIYLGIVPLTLALLAAWRIGLRRVESGGALVPAICNRRPEATDSRAAPDDSNPTDGGCKPPARAPGAIPISPEHPTAVWEVRLLAGATLLAVLLAMGDNFVLWRWLREVLPLGIMRFPVKVLLLAAFTVPLLAAWGVKLLFDSPSVERVEESQRIGPEIKAGYGVIGCICLLGVTVILLNGEFPSAPQTAELLRKKTIRALTGELVFAVTLISIPLFLFYAKQRLDKATYLMTLVMLPLCGASYQPDLTPTIPAHAFQPDLAAAYHASKGALTPAPKLGESRLMLSPLAERALHTRMVPKFFDDFIGQRLAFWGNLNLLDGLPKVNGASTLVTREWNDVEYFLYGTTNPAPANLMDFLGVTHTTKAGELMQWERRTNAMPLVSAGQQVVHGDDATKIFLPNLRRGDWNPLETVFITDDAAAKFTTRVEAIARVRHFQPRAGGLQPPSAGDESNGRRLQVAGTDADTASLIVIDAEAAAPTVVVVAQTFYPGWRATVNGQPAPVLRANHAFQAIPIPAGKSIVRLDYVDWPFRIGAGISLLTLLGCCLLWQRTRSSEAV